MNRRDVFVWGLTLVVLTLAAAFSAPAFPAETETEPDALGAESSREAVARSILESREGDRQGFVYDPTGRRDPFRSLYESIQIATRGPRPRGVAGMLVTEIDLTGIVQDPQKGDIAMVIGSDNKGYFLRVGDLVYDGTVIAVDPRLGSLTFRQQVDDPRLIKPYRDIVKRLVPNEDEETVDE